jgi:hypothetical protein
MKLERAIHVADHAAEAEQFEGEAPLHRVCHIDAMVVTTRFLAGFPENRADPRVGVL